MWMIKFVMEFVYVDDGFRFFILYFIYCSLIVGFVEIVGDFTIEDDGVLVVIGVVRA